jgi:hypothetical protein
LLVALGGPGAYAHSELNRIMAYLL